MRTCGIYAIVCTVNDKKYIGHSWHIGYRCTQHRNDLRRKKHSNPCLQQDWNEYGPENFRFDVVELLGDDKTILVACEIYWINFYKANTYNIIYPARILGRVHMAGVPLSVMKDFWEQQND